MMANIRSSIEVIFLGKKNSGKTALIKRTMENKFEEVRPTVNADLTIYQLNGNIRRVLDISTLSTVAKSCMKDASQGLLCVDLTEDIDFESIAEIIQAFQEASPGAPLVLVGTKSDLPGAQPAKLDEIRNKHRTSLTPIVIVTSAKTGAGTADLLSVINPTPICSDFISLINPTSSCSEEENVAKILPVFEEVGKELLPSILDEVEKQPSSSILEEAEKRMIFQLGAISFVKGVEIQQNLTTLKTKLASPSSPDDKLKAINDFTECCKAIIGPNQSSFVGAVYAVAVAAITITVASIIGFGVGFALGWWTGPGAFFSGVAAGYTAATAVATSSITAGVVVSSLATLRFFQHVRTTAMTHAAVDDFADAYNDSVLDLAP